MGIVLVILLVISVIYLMIGYMLAGLTMFGNPTKWQERLAPLQFIGTVLFWPLLITFLYIMGHIIRN